MGVLSCAQPSQLGTLNTEIVDAEKSCNTRLLDGEEPGGRSRAGLAPERGADSVRSSTHGRPTPHLKRSRPTATPVGS